VKEYLPKIVANEYENIVNNGFHCETSSLDLSDAKVLRQWLHEMTRIWL
jgi:hypothetical protein